MKRIAKTNKRGLTMVEMILVVAIIVILAAVVALNVSDIMKTTKSASENQDKSLQGVKDDIKGKEDKLAAYHF